MSLPTLPNDFPTQMNGVRVIKDYIPRPGNQPFIRFEPDRQVSSPRSFFIGTLHTTEGDNVTNGRATLGSKSAAATLCGPLSATDREPVIMVTRPPWAQHSALRDEGAPFHPNAYGPQIEMTTRTHGYLWLPDDPVRVAVTAYMGWCEEVYDIPLVSVWDGDPDGLPTYGELLRRKSVVPTRPGWTDHIFWGDGNTHGDCGALRRSVLFEEADVTDWDEVKAGALRRVNGDGPPGANAHKDRIGGFELANLILDKVKAQDAVLEEDVTGLRDKYAEHGHVTAAKKPTGRPVQVE